MLARYLLKQPLLSGNTIYKFFEFGSVCEKVDHFCIKLFSAGAGTKKLSSVCACESVPPVQSILVHLPIIL